MRKGAIEKDCNSPSSRAPPLAIPNARPRAMPNVSSLAKAQGYMRGYMRGRPARKATRAAGPLAKLHAWQACDPCVQSFLVAVDLQKLVVAGISPLDLYRALRKAKAFCKELAHRRVRLPLIGWRGDTKANLHGTIDLLDTDDLVLARFRRYLHSQTCRHCLPYPTSPAPPASHRRGQRTQERQTKPNRVSLTSAGAPNETRLRLSH